MVMAAGFFIIPFNRAALTVTYATSTESSFHTIQSGFLILSLPNSVSPISLVCPVIISSLLKGTQSKIAAATEMLRISIENNKLSNTFATC